MVDHPSGPHPQPVPNRKIGGPSDLGWGSTPDLSDRDPVLLSAPHTLLSLSTTHKSNDLKSALLENDYSISNIRMAKPDARLSKIAKIIVQGSPGSCVSDPQVLSVSERE